MGSLGKRASPEVASFGVALLDTCFKDLQLSRSGRKTLTAEVLDTLAETVTFLVRSSVFFGKYYGCLWSKTTLAALNPSVWPLLEVHKAVRATRVKPVAEQGQAALSLTRHPSDDISCKEVIVDAVVLAPLLALDEAETGLLHRGVLGEISGAPVAATDLLGATVSQLSHVHLVATALRIESMRQAIDDVLASRGAYAPKKRRLNVSDRSQQ